MWKISPSLCNALPAFHSFTGSNYKASLTRKEKITTFKLLQKRTKAREVFTEIGNAFSLNDSILERVEQYLCLLYGKKKYGSIDDVRLQMFVEKYKQFSKKGGKKETVLKIKKLGGTSCPPWYMVFAQKIKRTLLVARRWKCSYMQFQPHRNLVNMDGGWKIINIKLNVSKDKLALMWATFWPSIK